MNLLLVGVNASFSHTCLAVRQLSVYADIPFVEFTINQPEVEILRGIEDLSPDVILFSTYIWNAEMVVKIISDIKKILPEVMIGAGGPEFGYCAELYLKKLSALDFVMKGEGEEELSLVKKACCQWNCASEKKELFKKISGIKGIYLRKESFSDEKGVMYTGDMSLLCNLSELPFPYPEIEDASSRGTGLPESLKNKILYYESSRGCPFKCSYCLSSLDLRVRFMPLERVFRDIQFFLDVNAPLVKFVDRTYNLEPERYIAIWKYITEHHNHVTMFHFEIEGEFLSDEALDFLGTVPEGVMQFEIGVQSSNKDTLKSINRSQNIEKLARNVSRIPRTIHQHLDLIAGLPFEDMDSFGKSFDFVMKLRPDALQLGFLKVLHGTSMEKYALENGWTWMENPVYETFSTPYMTYRDILFLKDLEVVLDAYWNSGVFSNFMRYVLRKSGSWNFFKAVTENARMNKVFSAARRESFWFDYMAKLISDGFFKYDFSFDESLLMDLLRYDFILRGKQGNFPSWYHHRYSKERHRLLLEENEGLENARIGFAYSEYEVFDYDVRRPVPEESKSLCELLIKYPRRLK